jgi:hypothetical protein
MLLPLALARAALSYPNDLSNDPTTLGLSCPHACPRVVLVI